MNTNDKTLADVQPGGRVRLGDQAERARFEAWGRTEGLPLARAKLGGYAFEVTAKAWLAWQYLSAQPSRVARMCSSLKNWQNCGGSSHRSIRSRHWTQLSQHSPPASRWVYPPTPCAHWLTAGRLIVATRVALWTKFGR